MNSAEPTETDPPQTPSRALSAGVGLLLSILGLLIAALPPFLWSAPEPPPALEPVVSRVAPPPTEEAKTPAKSKTGLLASATRKLSVKLAERRAAKAAKEEAQAAAEAARAEHKAARDLHAERLVLLVRVGAGLGIVGIALALLGLARGESRRIVVLAVGLGVMAALWIYVLIAIALAVLILVVGAVAAVVFG